MSEKREILSLDEVMSKEVEITRIYIEKQVLFVTMPAIDAKMHNMLLMQRDIIIEAAEKILEQESKGKFMA